MLNLGKGDVLDLGKAGFSTAQLHQAVAGLGWDRNLAAFAGQEFDLDASALVFGEDGKPLGNPYFVYHRQLFTPDQLLRHTGDDKTGHGPGVDEALIANLAGMSYAARIVLMINIFEGPERGQTFEHVNNAFVNVTVDGQEKLRYDLDDDPRTRQYSSLAIADFIRPRLDASWSFRVLAQGFFDQRTMLKAFGLAA